MATATYDLIASQTLASSAASITFSSIAGTYTDLRIVLVSTQSVSTLLLMQFNSDTSTNYSSTFIYGDGTTASVSNVINVARIALTGNGATSGSTTVPNFNAVDIFSYAGSTYKTILTRDSLDLNGTGETLSQVGLWRSTSAITSIKLYPNSGNLNTGTTATLYGIKAA